MKKFFGFLLVFILFMCAVAFGLALAPPTQWAKYLVVKGVRTASGLDIKINGNMALSLVPSFHLRMEDVTLANPAQADKALIAARAVEVRSALWPLIWNEHRVEHVMLTDPRIDADIGKDGIAVGWPSPAATRSPDGVPSRGAASPKFVIVTLEATGAKLGYRDQRSGVTARLDGAKILARQVMPDRWFAEALVEAASAVVADPANGTIELGEMSAKASDFEGGKLRELSGTGATLRWRQAGEATTIALAAEKVAVAAQAVGVDGTGPVSISGGSLRWREPGGNGSVSASEFSGAAKTVTAAGLGDLAFKSSAVTYSGATRAGGTGTGVSARGVSGTAKSVKASRIDDLALASTSVTYSAATDGGATRASGAAPALPMSLEGLSLAAPVVAPGTPVDATVGFAWNKERVTGKFKLPAPEALAAGPAIPATFTLTANRGTFEFDGNVITANGGSLKGTAKASTDAVDALARWLDVEVPATVRGPANFAGAIDAQSNRIALSNGRIQHGANALTGSVAVDLGARTRVTGKLASDKLDANIYLGFAPAAPKPKPQGTPRPQIIEPEVPLSDVFKSYMRAMAQAPITRSGTLEVPDLSVDDLIPARKRSKPKPGDFALSDTKFNLSQLRSMDLDIDWSVKQLSLRGMELNVPQLKTLLNAGTLTLEGRDLATKGGRLSGRAEVDARQNVPSMSASLRGDGVDLRELSEAIGVTPMLEGATGVVANLTTSGNSQKQLVEGLSGRVQTNMPQGHVLGYDLGDITLSTIIRWLTGNREYDPERRTPVTGLRADLDIDKGVVRDSKVEMGGPFLGVKAAGTIRLVEQRLDYAGQARIASIFRGLQFKLFGDLTQPTFQPDLSLASVFSRSPPGDPSLVDLMVDVDLKDPELATLIGRVLERAGPRGLDPGFADALRTLKLRAEGAR